MGVDVLATQGARASATVIFTVWTSLIRSLHIKKVNMLNCFKGYKIGIYNFNHFLGLVQLK